MNFIYNDSLSDLMDKTWFLLFLKNEGFYIDYINNFGLSIDKRYLKVISAMKKSKKINDGNKLNFYFENFLPYEQTSQGNIFCITTCFCKIPDLYFKNFKESIEYVENLNDKQIKTSFIISLLYLLTENKSTIEQEAEKIISSGGELDFIKNSPLPDATKWKLFLVFEDPKKYAKELCDYLNDCYEDLSNALTVLNPIKEKWFSKIKNFEAKDFLDLIGYLDKFISFQDVELRVFPSLTPYAAILSKVDNAIYLGLGYDVEKTFKAIKGKDEMEYMLNILKSLSDNSRFNILKLLSEKEMYANEIAEKLKLSNATISHHMSVMGLQNLIKTASVQNKTYYTINKDTLNNFLEKLINEFNLKMSE